jgi:multicomponent K+:H+ antiporter subunit E
MKRGWFAHPVQSTLIAACWLLLQQSLVLPQLITAAVLALGLPRLLDGFIGGPSHPNAWGAAARLFVVVLRDIIVSNVVVARLVLSPTARPQPAWVPVALDLHHAVGITLLATIITNTPGTVSCVVDEAGRRILVHALDGSAGPEAIAADIKARYERPLMEIFQ